VKRDCSVFPWFFVTGGGYIRAQSSLSSTEKRQRLAQMKAFRGCSAE
jgi:hypothetical protein